MRAGDRTRRGDLAHPLPLAALVVLVVNDHFLKRVCPCWLTGKLSDVAGLFLFPVLLVTVVEALGAPRARRTLSAALASALTAAAFTLAKTVPSLNTSGRTGRVRDHRETDARATQRLRAPDATVTPATVPIMRPPRCLPGRAPSSSM